MLDHLAGCFAAESENPITFPYHHEHSAIFCQPNKENKVSTEKIVDLKRPIDVASGMKKGKAISTLPLCPDFQALNREPLYAKVL
jgi:hypothetical protein